MKLFRKYEDCYGISFPAIGQWKVEIWFCKPNYIIKEHSHNNEDIKLFFLFGRGVFFHKRRQDELFPTSFLASFPRNFLKCFNIWAGEFHYFEVSKWPLIFLNIEHFKKGYKPTSACDDLQLKQLDKENLIYGRSTK